MIDINNFDAIEISLASSKQIRSWSSGEVIKPETINYRTLKPEKDGLFCERIFGPTKDWECYCGKYKRVRYKGIVCERCGVEVTRSKVRRERMGHVDLAAPVSHIWFFKGVPSRIGYLLDMAPKELEKVLYFAASIITWVDDEARDKDLKKLDKEVQKVLDSYEGEREQRVQELRESLERRVQYLETAKQADFSEEDHLWADALDINIKKLSNEDREKLVKDVRKVFESDIADTEAYIEDAAERMRQVWDLFREMKPKDVIADETVFRELKDRFGSPFGFGEYFRGGMGAEAVRDLLEQVDLEAERDDLEEQVRTAKGQKQSRAVKRLKVVSAFINSDNKPEHMVLEAIPVIPPELRIHQCGLPKLMALELFKPFIMARLVERKAVQNIKAAKKMVDSMIPEVWDVLEEVIQEHPVLLNRAPTLHRLGLQAFEPVLVEGKAIQVHPLVCQAFNADFDGDQMAVHLPLSAEAQAEARLLMLSANNILSPAHGAPLATPTQDMVLGAYYLTYGPEPGELEALQDRVTSGKWEDKQEGKRPHVFRSAQEAELSYEHGMVSLHDLAEYRRHGAGGHVLTTVGRIIFNERVERALRETLDGGYDPEEYAFVNQPLKKRDMNKVIEALVDLHGPHAVALVLDAFKDLGFRFATQAGITVSKNDVVIPPEKEDILDRYEAEVREIEDQYDTGLITQEERHERVVETWTAATDEVGEAMEKT